MLEPALDPIADPIFALVAARHRAKAALDASNDWPADRDDEVTNLCRMDCKATYAALSTVPTTASGLLGYVEFAVEIYRELAEAGEGLDDWALGSAAGVDDRAADEIFMLTLLAAVQKLCGPVGDLTADEVDARIRQLNAEILSMNDQIAAHDLAAQQRKIPARNVHWLNRVRKARRMRLVEVDQLRAQRKRLKPFRSAETREAICDIIRERMTAGEWDDLVAEARDRLTRRAAA